MFANGIAVASEILAPDIVPIGTDHVGFDKGQADAGDLENQGAGI